MKMLLVVLAIFSTTICAAEDSAQKPKKKMVKKVVTYEEVEDDSDVSATEKKQTQHNSSGVHFDVLAGAAVPVGNEVRDLKTRFGYGAQVLFNGTPDFLIGAYYTTSNGSAKDFETVDFRLSYYGLVTQYKLSSIAFLQFKAGMSSLAASGENDGQSVTISASEHPFTVSAGLGLDLPITNSISFAPYASYTNSFATGSGDAEVKSYGLVEIMGALRFNF